MTEDLICPVCGERVHFDEVAKLTTLNTALYEALEGCVMALEGDIPVGITCDMFDVKVLKVARALLKARGE